MFEVAPLLCADTPVITQIETQCFVEDHWSKKQIQQQILNKNAINLGIFVDGYLVGYVLAGALLDEAELYQIALLPRFQGRGMAKLLLAQLCRQLRAAGIVRLLLEVREANLAAIELYKSFDFLLDGRRKGYYTSMAGVEDALLYSLAL